MANKVLELAHLGRRINSEFYLRDICLTLEAGQVHAVVGRNASGKSTLFHMVMGLLPPDEGEILLDGKPVRFDGVESANKGGLTMVAQNQRMFGNMNVYENLFFGHELKVSKFLPVISNKRMIQASKEIFEKMEVSIDPLARLGSLTDAQRQLASIARAVLTDAKVLLLDEPSTHLNADEKQKLYRAVNGLKAKGCSFLLISHDLNEVLSIADTISVMSEGEIIRTDPVSAFDEHSLAEAVYGIHYEDLYKREPVELGTEALRLEHVTGERFTEINLTLRHGQLTVLIGDANSGKQELVQSLAGLLPAQGKIYLNGRPIALSAPIAAVKAGIVLATTESDEEEMNQSEQIVDNGGTDNTGNRMKLAAKSFASGLEKTFAPYVGLKKQEEYMTGGNRQRELIERSLRKIGEVYLLYEPSAGIDLPARMGIYDKVSRLLKKGAAVLWLTSDLEEAYGLGDQVAVMYEGKLCLCAEKASVSREAAIAAVQGRGTENPA